MHAFCFILFFFYRRILNIEHLFFILNFYSQNHWFNYYHLQWTFYKYFIYTKQHKTNTIKMLSWEATVETNRILWGKSTIESSKKKKTHREWCKAVMHNYIKSDFNEFNFAHVSINVMLNVFTNRFLGECSIFFVYIFFFANKLSNDGPFKL